MFKAEIEAEEAYAKLRQNSAPVQKPDSHVFDNVTRKQPASAQIHHLETPQPDPGPETETPTTSEAAEITSEIASNEKIETVEILENQAPVAEDEEIHPVEVEKIAPPPATPEPPAATTVSETPKPVLAMRLAEKKDAATILNLIRELAEFEKRKDAVVADEDMLAKNLFAPHPFAECLLAEQNGEAAGFALFSHNFSAFHGKPGIYVENLYVRPQFRKQDIGSKLLRKLARLAIARQCIRLEWHVPDWNIEGLVFTNKLGARTQSNRILQRLKLEQIEKLAED